MTSNLYHVVSTDPLGSDIVALTNFFQKKNKGPLLDAQRLARHSWGFLGERMVLEEAQATADLANALGLPCRTVLDPCLPSAPNPVLAHGLEFGEEHANVLVGVPSTPRSLSYDKIKLLALARLRYDPVVTRTVKEEVSPGRRLAGIGMLALGIPIGFGKAKEVQQTKTETEWVMFLDLFGDGERWRINPGAFNFSGLGNSLSTNGMENIKRLMTFFKNKTSSVLLNRGARCFLEGRPLSVAGYDDLKDFEKECRWLMGLTV